MRVLKTVTYQEVNNSEYSYRGVYDDVARKRRGGAMIAFSGGKGDF